MADEERIMACLVIDQEWRAVLQQLESNLSEQMRPFAEQQAQRLRTLAKMVGSTPTLSPLEAESLRDALRSLQVYRWDANTSVELLIVANFIKLHGTP